ncbi:hypothetical protein EV702DRAFT_960196 [Suillus placidus]|uniref:Uncharacterized protein n=1 Tax=Suillus placidus TaxID=48579 RepID=A0A9P7A4Y6_9AGAM|nr:hypothetical protein EV702DRAFT_960196 [Suillus placidus]
MFDAHDDDDDDIHLPSHTVIGQHPTLFKSASLRNPVISVGELTSGTDIPDWVYAEFGVLSTDSDSLTSPPSNSNSLTSPMSNSNSPTTPTSDTLTLTPTPPLMTPQTYNTLFTLIVHVDNITVPVLIFIGEDDLRVVMGQGIGFYHAIKGRVGGITTGTGDAIGDGDANMTGTGETRTGRDKMKGIVEILAFPGESHAIEGVEAASWIS